MISLGYIEKYRLKTVSSDFGGIARTPPLCALYTAPGLRRASQASYVKAEEKRTYVTQGSSS